MTTFARLYLAFSFGIVIGGLMTASGWPSWVILVVMLPNAFLVEKARWTS